MMNEEAAKDIETARKVFLDTACALKLAGIDYPAIAAGAASLSAQLIGSISRAESIEKNVRNLFAPMIADAQEAHKVTHGGAEG